MSSARTARRSIGRPPQGTTADARAQLLDAALVLFAEHGVAGTTIAGIAARAGVTPAMVHYYFSNRGRLLDAVAQERLRQIVTAVWSPVVETDEVVPMLRGLVQRILSATELHPWLPSLWLREVVSEGGQLRERLLRILPFEYVRHLIGAVASAQSRGEVSPLLEPRLVLLSVLGLTFLPLATMRLWQAVPVLQGVEREDVARHAEALLARAFAKPAHPRTKAV
ncbi:MAG TPA: TetR/AcrR family transcriptional regulator [Steroidobacteraceae bacterium]|nr:TetR/AcrR family transcriptional regulator [Steroidobacteraceae bacterium]